MCPSSAIRLAIALAALAGAAHGAPLQDASAPEASAILEMIGKLRTQQQAAIKQRRTSAMETVKAAAGSGEKAVALWKEAVKTVQFDGAEDEGAKLRAFREGDGDAMNSKEAQTAAKLHMTWLYYTLQFHAGVKKKELVPLVIDYTGQLIADSEAMEAFHESMEKNRERESTGKHGVRKNDDARVKQIHDMILNTAVGSSPVAKFLGIEDILPRGANQTDRTAKAVAKLIGTGTAPATADDMWPMTPGDIDGIQRAIILPEYRATQDPRIIAYWDWVIRRESEAVAKRKVNYDENRFNTVRKPALVWQRAQDLIAIGLRNRAINDMVAVLKANPLHPQAENWMRDLESILSAPPSASAKAAPPLPSDSTPPPLAPPN